MQIPAAVVAAIKATAGYDEYPVTGLDIFDLPILKTRVLQFDSGATLQFSQINAPFLAICAQKIIFRGPAPQATITRALGAAAVSGIPGAVGVRGKDGARGGALGTSGTPGASGTAGQSLTLPMFYLFTEGLVTQANIPIEWIDLSLILPGVDGGAGGPGGTGGDGGAGAQGQPGRDAGLSCAQPPTPGGAGGSGGVGGAGGSGGNGSDGGNVVYSGPASALAQLEFIRVVNGGGKPGPGGLHGNGGRGGAGGQPGTNTIFCPPAPLGQLGRNGVDGADGASGLAGRKGVVSLAPCPDLSDLFS
jgi:hypothetical protein